MRAPSDAPLPGALDRDGRTAPVLASPPAPSVTPSEILSERPGPELRLAVLGTSLSAGQLWPEALASALQTCLKRPTHIQVFAHGGAISSDAARYLPALIAAAPDLILIEYAINDADLRRRVSLGVSRQTHLDLIDSLRAALPDSRIVLMRLNRAYGLRALLRPRLAAYEALYAELSRHEDVALADLRPVWAEALGETARRAAIPDGVHPIPEVAARIIMPALTSMLTAQACPAD